MNGSNPADRALSISSLCIPQNRLSRLFTSASRLMFGLYRLDGRVTYERTCGGRKTDACCLGCGGDDAMSSSGTVSNTCEIQELLFPSLLSKNHLSRGAMIPTREVILIIAWQQAAVFLVSRFRLFLQKCHACHSRPLLRSLRTSEAILPEMSAIQGAQILPVTAKAKREP